MDIRKNIGGGGNSGVDKSEKDTSRTRDSSPKHRAGARGEECTHCRRFGLRRDQERSATLEKKKERKFGSGKVGE